MCALSRKILRVHQRLQLHHALVLLVLPLPAKTSRRKPDHPTVLPTGRTHSLSSFLPQANITTSLPTSSTATGGRLPEDRRCS